MKNEKKGGKTGGLQIGEPRISAPGKSLGSRWVFCLFLVLLGSFGTFGCFYSGFSFGFSVSFPVLTTVFLSLLLTGIFISGKSRRFWGAAVFCLLVLIGFLYRDIFREGILRLVNGIIRVYTENSGFDMVQLQLEKRTEAENAAVCAAAAAYGMAVFVFVQVLLLTAGRKHYAICVLMTIPFFGASLVVGMVPDNKWSFALFLFWALLICDGGRLKGVSMAVLPAVLSLVLVVLGLLFPKEGYAEPDFMEEIRQGIRNGPDLSAMLRGGGIGGNVSRVELSGAGDIQFTGKTMLEVRTAKTDVDYLKGFVGSVYTGSSWEPLEKEKYEELETLGNSFEVQNFPYWFSEFLGCEEDYTLYTYDLTVRNVGTNPRCVYTPYGLINMPEDFSQIDFVDDSGLRSGNSLFGTGKYRLQSMNFAESYVYMTLFRRTVLWNLNRNSRLGVSAGSFYYGSMEAEELLDVPWEIFSEMTPEQRAFVRYAKAYRDFVYENYTQVPEELKPCLDEWRRSHGQNGLTISLENLGFGWGAASEITRYLQEENKYTLTPGTTPEGRDFVEYFLEENHRGYCRHFASAAVLLLRSAGVPARYVEGYAVSPDQRKNADGWIVIPDSSAHAWAEIYVSGVGWLPVETTGSVREDLFAGEILPEETESDTGDQEDGRDKETPEESRQETEAEHREAGKKEDRRTMGKGTIKILGPAAALLAFLTLSLWWNRKIRIRRREREFRQADRNLAALALYRYLSRIREIMGEREPSEAFAGEAWEEVEMAAMKAKFSPHMVSEGEIGLLKRAAGKYKREAEKNLTGLKKIKAKYIKGMF